MYPPADVDKPLPKLEHAYEDEIVINLKEYKDRDYVQLIELLSDLGKV